MNQLDQYVKNNLEAFEEDPATGHFERFQEKVKRAQNKKKIRRFTEIAAAACVVIVLSLGIFHYNTYPDKITAICENTDDMKSCYLNKIDDMAAQIDVLTQDMDKWNKMLVTDEVTNIVRSANDIAEMLPEQLPAEESNRILTNYYKNSLESLQTIVQIVNENNNQ